MCKKNIMCVYSSTICEGLHQNMFVEKIVSYKMYTK
jgi:hypothetical protein